MMMTTENMITALNILVYHPDKYTLIQNIYDTFHSINEDTIVDASDKNLFKSVKQIVSDLLEKGIRTKKQAKLYIAASDLDEGIKSLVNEDNSFPDAVLSDYNVLFSKTKHEPTMTKVFLDVEKNYQDFILSGINRIKENSDKFLDSIDALSKVAENIRMDSDNKSAVMITADGVEVESFGVNNLKEELKESKRRIKTGIWTDYLTGGGFKSGKLYIVASISGGFKSGFMQNMAEYFSIANKKEDLNLATGEEPVILYVNLEMSQTQMTGRRAMFYGLDKDYIETNPDDVETAISKVLKDNGSTIPVIYQKEKQWVYSSSKLSSDIKSYSKRGLKVIALVIDYSDLLKYTPQPTDEVERISPLVRKNFDLRAIAFDFNIPVLTGVQLNRGSSELKKRAKRAHKEDVLQHITSDTIAKSFDVINIPEQFFFCYKFPSPTGDDFFSIIVEKDRDNDARFINKEGKEEKSKLGRVHYCCRLNNLRLTNDYEDSVTKYGIEDGSVLEAMALEMDELDDID